MVNILVVCTGNSCRSVMGEALFNHFGKGRVRAFSAGSSPIGRINQGAVQTLKRHGLPTEGFVSQSWDEFADTAIDIAITVCDSAANEACPVYMNSVVRGHWGVSDPGHTQGTDEEIEAAFEKTFAILQSRVEKLLALPFEEMSASDLTQSLNQIGQEDD